MFNHSVKQNIFIAFKKQLLPNSRLALNHTEFSDSRDLSHKQDSG